jgi:hypothetical protein
MGLGTNIEFSSTFCLDAKGGAPPSPKATAGRQKIKRIPLPDCVMQAGMRYFSLFDFSAEECAFLTGFCSCTV